MEIHFVILILAASAGLAAYHAFNVFSQPFPPSDQKQAVTSQSQPRHQILHKFTNYRPQFQENETALQKILEEHYFKFSFCHVCKEVVLLVNAHITSNTSFSKFRPPAIKICEKVALIARFDQTICSGVVDTYGPPILYIVDQLVFDPTNICRQLGYCVPQMPKFNRTNINTKRSLNTPNTKKTENFSSHQDKPKEINSKKTLTVLQISDIHVDKNYKKGSASKCDNYLCCHEDTNGTEPAGQYGAYNCDVPWWTVDVLVDSIKEMQPQPDFIIYTGDSPPHDIWKETWATQISVDTDVVDFLSDRFNGITIYPTIGNHETFPANLYYSPLPEYQSFNQETVHLWKNLFQVQKSQQKNIKRAAYYTALVKPGLRILSFNSNYGYTLNFYALLNWKNPTDEEQRKFMMKTLHRARMKKEKVIIIGHVPPGDIPNTFDRYGLFYTDLVSTYRDVVVLQLFGHTHNDQYELVLPNPDNQLETSGVIFVAPSVTTYPQQNPAYRVYHLDTETYLPIDYDQYFLNITKANENMAAKVEHLYSAKSEYDLKDLSADSFLDLSKRFQYNDTLFRRYMRNRFAGNEDAAHCNIGCRVITICETLSSSLTAWLRCLAGQNNEGR